MPNPLQRAYRLNLEKLAAIVMENELTQEQLAFRANVSSVTISNIMNGKPAQRRTIRKIANALKVSDFRTLILSEQTTKDAKRESGDVEVYTGKLDDEELRAEPEKAIQKEPIKFQMTFSNESPFDEETSREAIAAIIKMYVDLKHTVTITAVKRGSVIVELELSEEDLLRLVAAFSEARLDPIHLDAIRLPATAGPLAAGLLQIIQPSDTPAKEMTNPVTPEMTLTRTPAQPLAFSVKEVKPNLEFTKKHKIFIVFSVIYALCTCFATFIYTLKIWLREKPRPGADHPHIILMGLSLNAIFVIVYISFIFLKSRKKQ
jgi:transcriptional regulator with XRE-family HTH domain